MLLLLLTLCQEHELVTRLRSERVEEREAAEAGLKRLGEAARPHLVRAAVDSDRELAARAGYLLRRLDLAGRLSPRLLKAFPEALDRLAVGDDRACAEILIDGDKLRKGARAFPLLKDADLAPLAAAAVRGAGAERDAVLSVVRRRQLAEAVPEVVPLLPAALDVLGEIGSAEAAPAIVPFLRHRDPSVRRKAIGALRDTLGHEAAGDLVGLLNDPERAVRQEAIEALQRIGARDAVPALVPLLADADLGVRARAVMVLTGWGVADRVHDVQFPLPLSDDTAWAAVPARAVRYLPAILDWCAARSRVDGADFFLFHGAELEVWADPLRKAFEMPATQCRAGEALCRIGCREALPRLLERLESGPVELRRILAVELRWLGGEEGLERATRDPDAEVRSNALRSLSIREFSGTAAAARRHLTDPVKEVRWNAVSVLAGGAAGVPTPEVLALLRDPDEEVRQSALLLVHTLRRPETVPALCELLASPEEWWRSNAAGTLGSFRAAEAAPDLVRLLEDPVRTVRAAAAKALGEVGAREAVPALRRRLGDDTAAVRIEAMRSLAALGDRESVPAFRRIFRGDEWEDARRVGAECLAQFGHDEGVPLILEMSEELWVLNALRFPEAWRRAVRLPRDCSELESALGLKVRGDPGVRDWGAIIEADHVRIVDPETEFDFWAEWWEGRKR